MGAGWRAGGPGAGGSGRLRAAGQTDARPHRGRRSAGMALARAWKRMSWFYYQYLLVTALYMLEPWERTVFNSMLVSVVGMALYTGYVFIPQHIMAILHYFEIVQ
ncbi:PREDICTED: serine palmitoyltransferase small subunit A [Chinchilla lanigera]|uniref:serine palmitoyltransferase small subunit A n=1 Tax=Chinchilla lanigera TaxID=34839 RepID=UPI000695BDE8|nr:PREDICTED: serine palmitoyltransferase small subunit A [Chinchilla lanigera]